MTKRQRDRVYYLILGAVTVLFLFTRLFRLDSVPFTATGMHVDELGAAYDSFCIANYGVDQYLYRFPVYFKCFGEGQNALYTYLAAIIFKIGVVSVFNYRLAAVIMAFLAYISLYFLARRLFRDRIYALAALALMTIMPVYMMSEHWGLECYLFLSTSIIAMNFLVCGIHTGKGGFYLLSGIMWGISLYTYAITYIVVPPFLLLALIYLLYTGKVSIRNIIPAAVPVILLGIPLLIQQLVMMGFIPPFTFLRAVDFWVPEFYRGSDLSPSYIPENLVKTPYICLVADYLKYNSNPAFGVIYYFSIPFVLTGIFKALQSALHSIRSRVYDDMAMLFLFYLVGRIATLFVMLPNTNRVNELYFPYLIFTVLGIKYALRRIGKRQAGFIIAAVYAVCFLCFARYFYFNREPSLNNDTKWEPDDYIVVDMHTSLAVREVLDMADDRRVQMIINDGGSHWWMSVCLAAGISPYDFNRHESKEPYHGKGFDIGVPDELDLSGDTVYLIQGELDHITDYLVSQGFSNDIVRYGGYSIVTKQ